MWSILVPIGITAIVMYASVEIVKVSTRFKENLERIRHGYPTLEGKTGGKSHPHPSEDDRPYVDMTSRPGGN